MSEERLPVNRGSVKSIVAGTFGHALEWFDFGVYAYLATILAGQFFPSADPTASLLASFAAFGVGFVARPLGGLVFGRMADRRGRKPVLLLTLTLMAVATLGIAVTPTYATVGAVAAVILVSCRLLQGFSAGGEVTTAATFLVEWAPRRKRGLYGSFMQIGSVGGLLAGSLTVAGCFALVGDAAMAEWGWRIPFAIGGVLAPIALIIRLTTSETPKFSQLTNEVPGGKDLAGSNEPTEKRGSRASELRRILRAFLFVMPWAVFFYFFLGYMPTYLQREFNVSSSQSLWITSVAMVIHLALVPVAGWLSDRIGRKPLVIAACVAFTILPTLLFGILGDDAPLGAIFAVVVTIGVILAIFSGPAPAAVAEFFPTKTRGSGLAIGYNVATVVFGGFTPYIAVWLTKATGDALAPAYYVGVIGVIGAIFMLTQRETAKEELV